jgi:hypothetical protein
MVAAGSFRKEGVMVQLQLNDAEARHLRAALERDLLELQREIAHTEHREFREILRERERVLTDVIERLAHEASVGA